LGSLKLILVSNQGNLSARHTQNQHIGFGFTYLTRFSHGFVMYRAIVTFGIHECIISGQYVVLVLGIHILQDFHIISLWTIIIHMKPPNVLMVIHNVDTLIQDLQMVSLCSTIMHMNPLHV